MDGSTMTSSERLDAVPRTAGTLLEADLNAILDTVPGLAARPGPRVIERVHGGLTNVNVKVTLPGQVAIARISTDDSLLLSIDRDAEHANSLSAARTGVAPPVLGRAPAAGVLVVQWVEGRTLAAADIRDDANLPRIAEACRRLHDGPRFVGDFDMFEVQRRYLRIVLDHGFRVPAGYLDLIPAFESMQRALEVRAEPTVPCHNDLLAENFIDDGTRLWLVDFEYSGNNDACFELGNIASESEMPVEQLAELVRLYYGEPDPAKLARARLLGLAAKYGWTLWAAIQHGASTVDFDFWSWGMAKYERAIAEFEAPDFDRLLEEVTAGA
jgi:thiamine kinase-like enzyme